MIHVDPSICLFSTGAPRNIAPRLPARIRVQTPGVPEVVTALRPQSCCLKLASAVATMSESKSGSKAEFLDTAFGYDATAFQAWKAKKPWLAEYGRGQHRWAGCIIYLPLHVCVCVALPARSTFVGCACRAGQR